MKDAHIIIFYVRSFLPARIFSLTISLCINIRKIEFTEWKFSIILPKKEVFGVQSGGVF